MSLFLKEIRSGGGGADPKGTDFDVRAKDWKGKQVKDIQ